MHLFVSMQFGKTPHVHFQSIHVLYILVVPYSGRVSAFRSFLILQSVQYSEFNIQSPHIGTLCSGINAERVQCSGSAGGASVFRGRDKGFSIQGPPNGEWYAATSKDRLILQGLYNGAQCSGISKRGKISGAVPWVTVRCSGTVAKKLPFSKWSRYRVQGLTLKGFIIHRYIQFSGMVARVQYSGMYNSSSRNAPKAWSSVP